MKLMRIFLIIAAALVIIGGIIFAAVMTAYKWDFSRLSTVRAETVTYDVKEKFTDMCFETDTDKIKFVPSEDGKCRLVCTEQEGIKHSVTVNEDKLTVKKTDERKWYEYIGVNFSGSDMTVYLPEKEYNELVINSSTGDIDIPDDLGFNSMDILLSTGNVTNLAGVEEKMKIHTSTGNITVENISAGSIDIAVTTGRIKASDITCKNEFIIGVSTGKTEMTNVKCGSLSSSGSTGWIKMNNVVVSDKLSVERSTGGVTIEGCDAAELNIETDTGDVSGTLLSPKLFITKSDTGRIEVPETTSGGKCRITTDTGDIRISIVEN